MPYETQLDERPAGYALEDATGVEGHPTKIVVQEFTSSEDGELFISRLEGYPSILISKLPAEANVSPSTVDHLLAIIRRDLHATIYVNELPIVARVRVSGPMEAGEAVREDDIADIDELTFRGIDVPADAAVLLILSAGWRKALFFDFTPLGPDGPDRTYNLPRLLGSYYAYLMNQSIFKLSEEEWHLLIAQGWFPFISLPKALLRTMVGRARGSGNLDILLPKIHDAIVKLLPPMLERWLNNQLFKPHIELLSHAAEEFQEGDYVSAVAIMYPRIEGLLRSVHQSLGVEEKATQRALTGRLIEARKRDSHGYSWLLPEMFQKYLDEAYFAHFEPGKPARMSRNSVGHGVADAADFNQKASCIGFLILDQLFYFLPNQAA